MRLLRKYYPLFIITIAALTSLFFMLMVPGDTKAATQCSTKDNHFYYTSQGSLCGKVEYPSSETMYFSVKNDTFTNSHETSIVYLKSKVVGSLTYYYRITVKKSTPSKGSILYRKYDSRTDKMTTIETKTATMEGTAHWKVATPRLPYVGPVSEPDPSDTSGATSGSIESTPKGEVELFFPIDTMFSNEACGDYKCWIEKVWAWATMIMLPLSIIMLIGAGALYATSAGNPDKISLAKKIIIGVLSGLALIVLARVLLINFVGLEGSQWNV
jgi:hypothetical protein